MSECKGDYHQVEAATEGQVPRLQSVHDWDDWETEEGAGEIDKDEAVKGQDQWTEECIQWGERVFEGTFRTK